MNKFEEVFKFYEGLLKRLLDLAVNFTFDADHPLHLAALSLYGSIIELSSSLKPLYLSEHYSSIPIVLRSLLEAHVDLENLSKDPKYGYSLDISYLKESLKFLLEAKNNENIYMGYVAQKPDLNERIAKFESDIASLKAKGYKSFKNFDKFKKAGLLSEYRTIYNMLCCASHNNYRSLRDRHISFEDGSVKVEYFKLPDFEELESWFGVTCEILIRASFSIHELLQGKCLQDLHTLRTGLNKIRGDA